MAAAPQIKMVDYLASTTGQSKNWVKKQMGANRIDVNGSIITYPTATLSEGDVVTFLDTADTASTGDDDNDGQGETSGHSLTVGEPVDPSFPYLSKDAQSTSTGAEKNKQKFLHARAALKKIQYDPNHSSKSWLVGYEDRFTGIQEVSLAGWHQGLDEGLGSIPIHRVRYLKGDGIILWDRRDRTNNL